MSDFSRYERPTAWVCGRTCEGRRCLRGPSPSGHCSEPEPCIPRRSLRSQRRIFVCACTAISLAALMVMLSQSWWSETIAPGPLTLKHAQILNRNSTSNRCAACHEAGGKGMSDWAAHLVGTGSLKTPQSTLCLKCHEKGLDSLHALLPHGVDPERLAKHTGEVALGGSGNWPGLVSIPRNERGEIGCAACHREHHGADQNLAALSNQQCQVCHANAFHSFSQGHPEFTNWPLDRRSPIAFDHAGHKAKHFPAGKQEFRCQTCHVDDSRRDVKLLANFQTACASCHEPKIKQSGEEGWKLFALPGLNVAALREAGLHIGEWPAGISQDFDGTIPPAMALLLAADEKAAKALAKIPGGDLSAIDPANKEQLAAAATVTLESKRLLHELTSDGEAALGRRFKLGASTQVSGEEASRLWAQLPPDLLRAAQVAWLPKLDEEVALLREGKPLPVPTPSAAPPATIREPAQPSKKPDDGDDLLKPASNKPDDDLLSGPVELKPSTVAATVPAQSPPSSAGWFRSDASYSIAWRPAGHADPLLKAWIEYSIKSSVKSVSPADALQKSLTKPVSVGYCAQCHRLDSGAVWQASRRDLAPKDFTKFSHRPHLIQPLLADCTHCHELAASGAMTAAHSQPDLHPASSGFASLTKSACTSCHVSTAAGDQCLKCHNYHIGGQPVRR